MLWHGGLAAHASRVLAAIVRVCPMAAACNRVGVGVGGGEDVGTGACARVCRCAGLWVCVLCAAGSVRLCGCAVCG